MTAPTIQVTVSLEAMGGPAIAGVQITATLDVNERYEDAIVIAKPVTLPTGADGKAVFDLFPNLLVAEGGLGTQGSTYRFTASVPGGRPLDVFARFPNADSQLEDWLAQDDPLLNAFEQQSVIMAREWAIKTDGQVSGIDYSAKEFAQGSQPATGGSAKHWAQEVGPVTGAGANDRSAKSWAQADLSGATLGGSSKDWSQKTNGTVDGANFSAKELAIGSQPGTGGSAKDWAQKTGATVDGATFSSKEFAQGSQAGTGGSSKNWAQTTGADVPGAAAGSRSSKSWAQEDLTPTGQNKGGSAKDWAQSPGLPDGANKSAKSYAGDAAGAAGTATGAAATATAQAGVATGAAGTATAQAVIATTKAGEAVVSAGNASFSAAAALADRLLAEAASVVSLNLSGLKDTVDDGMASTANGAYFAVVSTASSEYLRIYKNNAGFPQLYRIVSASTALLSYFGISASGNTQLTPFALSPNDANLGWYEIATSYLFQDRFGLVPVTALGQNVGLVVPRNGELGPSLIPAASATFTSAAGWSNVNSGWTIDTTGQGKAHAVAATGTLTYNIAAGLTASRHACVDIKISNYAAGTLQVDVGAGFVNVPLTANGTYRVFTGIGGSPATGLQLRCPVAFTGDIEYAQVSMAPVWTMYAPDDAHRPVYNLGPNNVPRIDFSISDSRLKTDAAFNQTVPSYACLALGRSAQANQGIATFGYITYGDGAASYSIGAGTALAGQFHSPSMRPGGADLLYPNVVDCYLEAGWTSSYINNSGTRDVYQEAGLSSGSKRKVANNFTGAESTAGVFFGINYTGGLGAVNEATHFYGGCLLIGSITPQQRRKVREYFVETIKFDALREPEYDLFGFIGQSNMMGVGNQATSPVVPFGQGAEYIDSGHIKPLKDPTQHAVPNNAASSGSLLPACANAWYAAKNRPMLCVGAAASGVGLTNTTNATYGNWLTGRYPRWFGQKFKNAMRDVRCIPRGVFYLGGEQDASLAYTQAQYEALLIQLRDKIRIETGIPNLPLLIISLDDTTGSPPQYAIERAAMANVAFNGGGNPQEGIYLVQPYQNWLAAGHLSDGIHRDQFALSADGTAAGTNAAALQIFDQ